MTRHYAVIGSPITQSKSPQLHNAAFIAQGIAADYTRYEVANGLAEFLGTTGKHLTGVSVTMPLKEEALSFASTLDSAALQSRSCNTLVRSGSGWDGYNTDVFGLTKALEQVPTGKSLIIGSGATSRSAFLACTARGDEVSTWARSRERFSEVQAARYDPESPEKTGDFDLIVSTIPSKSIDEHFSSFAQAPKVFLSAGYSSLGQVHSRWLQSCQGISGLEMLLWQAIAQQAIFNGLELATLVSNQGLVGVMRESLRKAVEE